MAVPDVQNDTNRSQNAPLYKQQEVTWGGKTWNILNLRCLGNSPFAVVARIVIGLFEATIGAFIVGGLTGMIGYVPLVVHGLAIVGCAFKDMLYGAYLAQLEEERKCLDKLVDAQERPTLTSNPAIYHSQKIKT